MSEKRTIPTLEELSKAASNHTFKLAHPLFAHCSPEESDPRYTGTFASHGDAIADASKSYKPGSQYEIAQIEFVNLAAGFDGGDVLSRIEGMGELMWLDDSLVEHLGLSDAQLADLTGRLRVAFNRWLIDNSITLPFIAEESDNATKHTVPQTSAGGN